MTTVVLDTNTVVSAIFWPRSTARRCLAGLARRWYAVGVSSEVFTEYEAVVAEFQPRFPACNSAGALAWLRLKADWVEPIPLGKGRSRDPKDDPFLACALAVRAKLVVSRDQDLLVLGKPFGIEIITPARFLAWLRENRRPGALLG
ncbi:MAG TPA: putative toxin-antitoxin system toxin component, PIN family [Candidatus Paceibacterota bacterium]|nr:putative toxin-antitoxin system toxin component, PIN family [Verrucomicrobiota bacterium]HRY46875.1 putative toxin-antitoxin system toxin component, PIN family [Candidatus Paceibacterota bacterium]